MFLPVSALRPLTAAVILAASAASQAAITVYTDEAAFLAAVGAPGTDSFDDLALGFGTSPVFRIAGSYSYSISAANGLYQVGDPTDVWLSVNDGDDPITFDTFSAGVVAVGGHFFGTDQNGAYLLGDVTVWASDSSGTVSRTITGAAPNSFLGFISDDAITSLLLAPSPSSPNLFAAANNVTLAAAVPEPATYALALAGLAVVGWAARRQRR